MVTLREIQSISPYDFEKLIAELWETKGYDTEVRRQSRDKGIDIDAERAGLSEKIQVKRYSGDNKIGSIDVRKSATIYQQTDANNVVLVTSGEVTDPAEELAQDLSVGLINGNELINQLEASSVDVSDYTGSSGAEDTKETGVDKTQSRQDISSRSYREGSLSEAKAIAGAPDASDSSMNEPDTDQEPDVSAFMHNPDEEPEVLDLATYEEREISDSAADEEREASELTLLAIVYHIVGVLVVFLLTATVSVMLGLQDRTGAQLSYLVLGTLTIGFAIKDNNSTRVGTWILGVFYLLIGLL
jgi:hypothetical protein